MILTLDSIADKISGELMGPNREFRGIFTTLGHARSGDIVIRHWIDENGVKIASRRDVCAMITTDPRGGTLKIAKKLGIPIILVDKIESANAFALEWTIRTFTPDSTRVVVTGTNGKSTTTHMIYHVIKTAGASVYTNTDSKSEFNTLIDPVVPSQIAEAAQERKLEYLIIEVSEVQGWLGRVMKDHAFLMTRAIDPQIAVITNVALDHIGLIKSIKEAQEEISGALRAMRGGFAVLNNEDDRVKSMADLNEKLETLFYGDGSSIFYKNGGIYLDNKLFLADDQLPFQGKHFIQNTLAAIATCKCLGITPDHIKKGIYSYKPLKRRFSIICDAPLIIDDFAHNPAGIKATIENAARLCKGSLWIVSAIRGSRGRDINTLNAKSIGETIKNKNIDYNLIVTDSNDVVDHLNIVKDEERKVFLETLDEVGVDYIHKKRLRDALIEVLDGAREEDTILLIGAQGMDPASGLLKKILKYTSPKRKTG